MVANVGLPELVVLALILGAFLVGIVPVLWAVVHAARMPDEAWRAAGMERARWIVIPVVSMFLCTPAGAIAAAVYALRVRPALMEHARAKR